MRQLALIALLIAGIAWGVNLEEKGMGRDFGEMHTWCVGRHLVDLPEFFNLATQSSIIRGVEIETVGPGNAESLERIFSDRVASLQTGKVEDSGTLLIFRDSRRTGNVYILAYSRDFSLLGGKDENWEEEAYSLSEGVLFRSKRFINADTAAIDQQTLLDVALAIRPISDEKLPSGDGACIAGAFVSLPVDSESHSASFIHSDVRPLGFNFVFTTRGPNGEALEIQTGFNSSKAKSRMIAGLSGNELMLYDGQISFAAITGYSGGQGSVGKGITVEYFDQRRNFGQDPVTSATAAEIWSAVLDSIRLKR